MNCSALALVMFLSIQSFITDGRAEKAVAMRVLKSINRRGPYLGLITTFSTEEKAFFGTGAFVPSSKHPHLDLSGRRFMIGTIMSKKVVYVCCGEGMVNAAAATQQMIDMFDVTGIVHFGIAGKINTSMSIGDVSIPKEIANTGLWHWLNINSTVPSKYAGQLKFGNYNEPKGDNNLGHIGYAKEQFYDSKKPNDPEEKLWFSTNNKWLQLASKLQGMKLEKCPNSTYCFEQDRKVLVGLKGSTSDIFVDNAAYGRFLFDTFQACTADMESSAVVMTCLSNGYPVIVIRSLSDNAGNEVGENEHRLYGGLAALNAAKVVIEFIKIV